MSSAIEKILLWIVSQVLTTDVIKGSEAELIAFLRSLAAKSPEAVLFNGLIDLVAVALGVQG